MVNYNVSSNDVLTLLQGIYNGFHASKGILRKKAISRVTRILEPVSGQKAGLNTFGDDAAPVPYKQGYLLLAADGIAPYLMSDSFWVGYCSVLVNVNDIYAMGGRPLAMVNVLASPEGIELEEIVRGIEAGCRKFGVPMVGGHLHPETESSSVSVAILGEAKTLLTSFDAMPGDLLVLAIDLAGEWHDPFPHWDSTSKKTPEEVQSKLALLPDLTEQNLLQAGKDISNPGILGTIGMLMESSGVGAVVNLDYIPLPSGVPLDKWVLYAYPGFGFVFSVSQVNVGKVISAFSQLNVSAGVIGQVNAGGRLVVEYGDTQLELIDFATQTITGIKNTTVGSGNIRI